METQYPPMSEAELKEALRKIENDYEQAKKRVYIAYAFGNAKYKVGDIIKESTQTILVQKIKAYIGLSNTVQTVYEGIELKADLTPKKNGAISSISIYSGYDIELIKSAE